MLEEVQIWLVSTRALKIILAMVLLVNTKGTSLWLPLVVVQFTENCVLSTQMSIKMELATSQQSRLERNLI